jgi:hypothetical protein
VSNVIVVERNGLVTKYSTLASCSRGATGAGAATDGKGDALGGMA